MRKRSNEDGFLEELGAFVIIGVIFFGFLWFIGSIRFEPSEQVVSGIAYNVTNNAWISGKTNFSVRAGIDTYVDSKNESSYCLPNGSPYISLVNKAAANKNVKIIVTTKKFFGIVANPWVCVDNVTVTQVK